MRRMHVLGLLVSLLSVGGITATAGQVTAGQVTVGQVTVGQASSATGHNDRWAPPADTIVAITGGRANGFEITYYDGSQEFPPTGSEATAECTEYDAKVDRVRCTAQVRTRYRVLADTRRAIRYARAHPG